MVVPVLASEAGSTLSDVDRRYHVMETEQRVFRCVSCVMFLHGLFTCFDTTRIWNTPKQPFIYFLISYTYLLFSRRMALVLSCWVFCIMASVRADEEIESGSMKGSFTHSK